MCPCARPSVHPCPWLPCGVAWSLAATTRHDLVSDIWHIYPRVYRHQLETTRTLPDCVVTLAPSGDDGDVDIGTGDEGDTNLIIWCHPPRHSTYTKCCHDTHATWCCTAAQLVKISSWYKDYNKIGHCKLLSDKPTTHSTYSDAKTLSKQLLISNRNFLDTRLSLSNTCKANFPKIVNAENIGIVFFSVFIVEYLHYFQNIVVSTSHSLRAVWPKFFKIKSVDK